MKKQVLKTILKDFFKLKYPIAMIIAIVILGAGIVLADSVCSNLQAGLDSIHNNHMQVNDTNGVLGACQIVHNNTGSGGIAAVDYFIPTRTKGEWDAFKANLPANVTLSDCGCQPGYAPWISEDTCSPCGDNAHYCPGLFDKTRHSVSSGYWSTGGHSDTRTSQSKCGSINYYCTGGVRHTVSNGYYTTGGTSETRTGQTVCGRNEYYCFLGVRHTVDRYHYSVGGTSATRTSQQICPINYYCTDGQKIACPSLYNNYCQTEGSCESEEDCCGGHCIY